MTKFYYDLLRRFAGRAGWLIFSVLALAYGWMALRGPQGLPVLFEKRREIRELEEQNSEQARDNQLRRERIQRLEKSRSEQEMEIRKQLKLLRPGETTFILPEAPKEQTAP